MRVIRDKEEPRPSIHMILMMLDWGIRRCNVKGCTNEPNTVIAGLAVGIVGLCEEHFQQGNVPGGSQFDLEFDNFDAFARERE